MWPGHLRKMAELSHGEMDLSAALRVFGWILALLITTFVLIAGLYVLKGRTRKWKGEIVDWFNGHQSWLLLSFIALFVLCVTYSTIHFSGKFLPPGTAEPESDVRPLFNMTAVLTGIAFFLTQILLFYFPFRYRAVSTRRASYVTGIAALEFVWTFITAVAFLFLFLWGHRLWKAVTRPPEGNVLVLEVLGEQFHWSVRYPGPDGVLGKADFRFTSAANRMGIDTSDVHAKDDFVPLQMHIPKGRPVKLLLRSNDVIHSFFIPYFKVKMDAVPGMTTRTYFTATTSTEEMRTELNNEHFDYEVACAELCGRLHFGMKLILKVDEPEAFDKWSSAQEKRIADNLATESGDYGQTYRRP